MKAIENFIADASQPLPSHLTHEILSGFTTDEDTTPIVIKTITGILSAHDLHLVTTFLQAEHDLMQSFQQASCIVKSTFYCGALPANVELYDGKEVPTVGIYCVGYINSLKQQLGFPLPLLDCIKYSINLCDGLGEVHQRMLAHRNLNPSCLLLHQSGEVHLFGFYLSKNYETEVGFDMNKNGVFDVREHEVEETRFDHGTESLLYISPEHTGRVHNKPDQRSDMYCLGVIMYEMLTGYPPFQFDDPLQMIHAHIARQPPQLPPSFSSSMSEIILSLLSKDPDKRYFTPIGLKADLKACYDSITKHGEIKPFALRKQDLIAYPRIKGGLHGRQSEVSQFVSVLQKIREATSVFFICGNSGVGKTALVNALLKDTREHGMYGAGKFDEYYATSKFFGVITSSIHSLLVQSLTNNMQEWKKKLSKVISGCEHMFLDMFPDMESYVDKPNTAEQVPPVERKNRMHCMISDLIVMLTQISPVILFFDDLQWADPESLELIEVIVNARESNILIIGTYRTEVSPALEKTVNNLIKAKKSNCTNVLLKPFSVEDVLNLLCDSLQDDRDRLKSLAEMIHSKTGGNTLFVIQFLASLYRRSLVKFDWENQKWTWDAPAISGLGYANGLVSFFLNTFHDISEAALNLLTFASLLGTTFDVALLSNFSTEFGFPQVTLALNEAIKYGFLVGVGKDEYRFIHDKIRQSAYTLSSDKLRKIVYERVGIHLLNSDNEESKVTSMLYLKYIPALLLENAEKSEEGKKMLTKATATALKAGLAAKTASAYQSALDYLKLGCNMLNQEIWENANAVAYSLKLAAAECLYLCGSKEEGLTEFAALRDRPITLEQKVGVYQTEMQVLSSSDNYARAITIGLSCCSLLGFEVCDVEANIQTCAQLIKAMDADSILRAPQVTDRNLSLLMDTMASLIMIAYFGDKQLFMLVSSEMVRITLKYGPSPSCGTGLVFFAMYYGPAFKDPENAYLLGKLSVDLCERFPLNAVRSKVHFLFTLINVWRNNVNDNFKYLQSALKSAQAIGDYLYTGYCLVHMPNTSQYAGRQLSDVLQDSLNWHKFIVEKTKYNDMILLSAISLGYTNLLLGLTKSEDSYDTVDGSVVGEKFFPARTNGPVVVTWAAGSKIESFYMFGYYKKAIEQGEFYLTMVGSLLGHIHEPRAIAYYALSMLAILPSNAVLSESTDAIEKVKGLYQYLDLWITYSAQNFLHYDMLIQAEIARVEGKIDNALKLFDKAAIQARTNSYEYIEALAGELSTRCMIDCGMNYFAESSLKRSVSGYKKWGAVQKVRQVERKYAHIMPAISKRKLLANPRIDIPATPGSPCLTANTSSSGFTDDVPLTPLKTRELDMRTIIKANHVLSQEIALPQLLHKFVNIVVENVGAEQAAIVLVDGSSWKVAASWSVRDEVSVELDKGPLPSLEGARKNIVNYVMHTKQPIAIDSFEKSDFYDPSQGIEIGSVLCVPISLKGLVCGVVYLEHSVQRVLQEDRFELMQLLCTQLYISVENANLYKSTQASEHRYKTFAEGLPIMAFSTDSVGRTFTNSKLLQFMGLGTDQAESIVLEDVIARIHQADVEIFVGAWKDAGEPNRPAPEVEMRLRRASDGVYRWTLCHVTPAFDSQNRVEMFLGTFMDIQDLKDAQIEQLKKTEIEASEKKYRSLAEAIPQIVWTAPSSGGVNYFNKRWYDFTGLSELHSLGEEYLNAFHPADISAWPKGLLDIGSDFEAKLRIKRKDGAYRWHLARAIYLPSSVGVQRFGSFTDIEDQIQVELSLDVARKNAEKSAHNQSLFLANMSHEIRTPMNGILGMLHLLLETELTDEQRDYSGTMKRSADALLRIIDDVLDFSKIQEGKLELHEEPMSVELVLEGVIENLSILAVGAELMLFVHHDVPIRLIGDSGKLRQVVMNLLGNAVKFASLGDIYVSCVVDSWHGDEVLLKFQISDTGEGISQEKQSALFTPFYQADSSTTRQYGGTGLGLAICKQLVTLFHGTISVESTRGKGSTFTFTSRFKVAPERSPPPVQPFSSTWRALVISNLAISRNILENHLRTWKVPFTTKTTFSDAKQCLNQDNLQNNKFNYVIIDTFSHLQTDHDALNELKPYLADKRVILVATSLQRPHLLKEFPNASFLLKPINLERLSDSLLGHTSRSVERQVTSCVKYSGSSRVMIVEDNNVNQKVMSTFFKKRGIPYSIANNGLEAFQQVKEKPFGYFSIIFMDLAMPVWDGYRSCTEIRNLENGTYRHPVVALTASVQDGIINACKACGMDDFLSKPVDFKQLSGMLDKYLIAAGE